MKHRFTPALLAVSIAFTAILALPVPVRAAANATLTQAQLTLIIKDVKTIDPGKSARAAVLKETVQGAQTVRTGIESRTELYFNDKTITRLGANTHFSFEESTRNMSLQSGVMLLQVPKGIGGAKIETPAVTAGITGTTIMLDAGAKFTKLIVLEGDTFLIAKLKGGKTSRRVWVHAGQELIITNGSDQIPKPFFVNLKLLESTSLLLTGKWGTRLDYRPIIAAANDQKPGDFAPATGVSANTVTTIGKLPQGNNNTPPPPPPPPPPSNPNRPR